MAQAEAKAEAIFAEGEVSVPALANWLRDCLTNAQLQTLLEQLVREVSGGA